MSRSPIFTEPVSFQIPSAWKARAMALLSWGRVWVSVRVLCCKQQTLCWLDRADGYTRFKQTSVIRSEFPGGLQPDWEVTLLWLMPNHSRRRAWQKWGGVGQMGWGTSLSKNLLSLLQYTLDVGTGHLATDTWTLAIAFAGDGVYEARVGPSWFPNPRLHRCFLLSRACTQLQRRLEMSALTCILERQRFVT